MISSYHNTTGQSILTMLGLKVRDYALLAKLRLSTLVVFSAAAGYVMAVGLTNPISLVLLLIGGFLVTAGSNAINQVLEKEYDKLMNRTQNRPLPADRMKTTEALLFSGVCGISGIIILWVFFNPVAGLLGALAYLSYAFVYTPMKRISSVAVLLGAFPGAIPPVIGWVAATGDLAAPALVLFAIQFLWQFPHFWAIAWVAHEDYTRAGFKLLPGNGEKSKMVGLQCLVYSALLIPVSLVPFFYGYLSLFPAAIILLCGVAYLAYSWNLYSRNDDSSARKLMFSSFVYLPVVLITLMLAKAF